MRRLLVVGLLALLSGCASIGGVPVGEMSALRGPGSPGLSVRMGTTTARVVASVDPLQGDTLEVIGTWTNPPGQAAVDSLEVWGYGGLNAGGTGEGQRRSFAGGQFPTTARFIWPLALGTSQAASATVCVITWRGGVAGGTTLPLGTGEGSVPPPANCAPYVPYEVVPTAPPMVTGVSASVRIIRP